MGIEPLRSRRAAARAAAILPLPAFLRQRLSVSPESTSTPDAGVLATLAGPGAQLGTAAAERAATLLAAVAIAGAGGAVLGGAGPAQDAWPTGGDNRGDVAQPQPTRAQPERKLQRRSRSNGAVVAPSRRPGARSRARAGGAPPGAARPEAPGAGPQGAAPAVPQAGAVKPPASPQVPPAPRVDVAPPATPVLPAPPAFETLPAPVAVPDTATKLPKVDGPRLRNAFAPGS